MNKKQKRALGEARAIKQAEESRLSGLKAQQRDRERRLKKQQEKDAVEQGKKASRTMVSMAAGPFGEGDDGGCN